MKYSYFTEIGPVYIELSFFENEETYYEVSFPLTS